MSGDSGEIKLIEDKIVYRSSTYGKWKLSLLEIQIIGEKTNDHGPYLDDYFLCFATGPEECYEASFYAEGREDFIRDLSEKLCVDISLALTSSTDFTSKVIWPTALIGQPMFKYTEVQSKTWFRRLTGSSKILQTYSDVISEALKKPG